MLYWTIFLAGMSLKEALDCGSAAIAAVAARGQAGHGRDSGGDGVRTCTCTVSSTLYTPIDRACARSAPSLYSCHMPAWRTMYSTSIPVGLIIAPDHIGAHRG